MGIRAGQTGQSQCRETMGPLLRDMVALLAMKRGRAPLALSSSRRRTAIAGGSESPGRHGAICGGDNVK